MHEYKTSKLYYAAIFICAGTDWVTVIKPNRMDICVLPSPVDFLIWWLGCDTLSFVIM